MGLINNEDAEDNQRPFIPKRNARNYKPLATTIPILLLFTALLAMSVGLIEALVHNVRDPSTISKATVTKILTAPPTLRARASPAVCSDFPSAKAAYTQLASSVLSVCETYSKSYLAGSSLSPAKQTAFQQWLGTFSRLQTSRDDLLNSVGDATADCKYRHVTTVPAWEATKMYGEMVGYVGCTTMTIGTPCILQGTITLQGTTVMSTSVEACGASLDSMLTMISGQPVTVFGFTTGLPLPTAAVEYVPTATVTIMIPGNSVLPYSSILHTENWVETVTMYYDVNDSPNNGIGKDIQTANIKISDLPSATEDSTPPLTTTSGSAPPTTSASPSATQESTPLTTTTSPNPGVQSAAESAKPDSSSPSSGVSTDPTALSQSTTDTSKQTTTLQSQTSSTIIPLIGISTSTGIQSTSSPTKSGTTTLGSGISTTRVVQSNVNSAKPSTTSPPSVSRTPGVYTITSVIATTDKDGHSTTLSVKFISVVSSSSTTTITSPPSVPSLVLISSTSTASTSSTTIPSFGQVIDAKLAQYEQVVDRPFSEIYATYFASVFLPPILAVIYKVLFEIIYSSFKMMEPFYRLTDPKGVPAKQSLFAQYLSTSMSRYPFKACFDGYYLPLVTMITYCSVSVLAALASATMTIRPTDTCEVQPGVFMPCSPRWFVNMVIIRIIEGLLIAGMVFTLCIIPFSWTHKSGVSANPSSIASVASLVNHDELIQDFRRVDPQATKEQLINALHGRQCRLEHRESANNGYNYGIGRLHAANFNNLQPLSRSQSSSSHSRGSGYSAVHNPALAANTDSAWDRFFSRKLKMTVYDVIQLLSSMALFTMVTYNVFNFDNNSFNRFFNSGTFTGSFVFVGVASIVDIQWKRLEREVRITEPYRRMAMGFQQPETTVLMTLNGTCWSSLFGSVYKFFRFRNMWFQTLVSLTAVLSDFNIIAVACAAYSSAQTKRTFYVAGGVTMTITALMIVVMLVTMIWWRRGVVRSMPRSPSTIGTVFSYLCASRFTRQMNELQLENIRQKERDDHIVTTGWRFTFGWRVGLDGQNRWMVDYENTEATRKLEEKTFLATHGEA